MHLDFCFGGDGDHRELHVLPPAFPTQRSSDLSGTPSSARTAGSWSKRPKKQAPSPASTAASSSWSTAMPPSTHQYGTDQAPVLAPKIGRAPSELQSLMRHSYAVIGLAKKIAIPQKKKHTRQRQRIRKA